MLRLLSSEPGPIPNIICANWPGTVQTSIRTSELGKVMGGRGWTSGHREELGAPFTSVDKVFKNICLSAAVV
jgi:hypothetical protein